jgi:hypothetical protein
MNNFLEVYKDLAAKAARPYNDREMEDKERCEMLKFKRIKAVRRGLVIAVALGSRRVEKGWKVNSPSGEVYMVSRWGNRWNCGCEYWPVAPRFDWGGVGRGRLCKHVVGAMFYESVPEQTLRPLSVEGAFRRIVDFDVPVLMHHKIDHLKEWKLWKKFHFNIDELGWVRMRIKPWGRSSKALARVWPMDKWCGSGPAPYECKVVDGFTNHYHEWLAKQEGENGNLD